MVRVFPDWRGGRFLVALLLVCALAIRIAVPAGFMPAVSSSGVTLVLCSAMGGGPIEVDFGKSGKSSDMQKAAGAPCAFGGSLGGGTLPETLPVAVRTAYSLIALPHRAIADLTTHRLAAPPPLSHAPPALA